MTIATLFLVLFICMLLGMPIAIALGFSSVLTILIFSNDSLASVALKFFEATSEHYTLLAIPFFIMAGELMSRSGMLGVMIGFANAVVMAMAERHLSGIPMTREIQYSVEGEGPVLVVGAAHSGADVAIDYIEDAFAVIAE
ncbi:MAG: TRAP transporter large permease subunit, partial [Exilibacterium sp.]